MDTSPLHWVDWDWLGRQIPWLIGASLLVATLSWGDWSARVQGIPRRVLFSRDAYVMLLHFSLGLIALGLALNPVRPWEVYVSGGLTLVFWGQAARHAYAWMREHRKESAHAQ